MAKEQQPSFTFINYSVCSYCINLVRGQHRDGWNHGCGLIQNAEGQYARLTMLQDEIDAIHAKGGDAINELKGCERFKPSGLPSYTSIRETLIKRNPLTASIPEDPNATETSYALETKIGQFPHKEIPLLIITPDGKMQRTIQ